VVQTVRVQSTQSMLVNVRCLRDIQDRQVACYSVSCKERPNIGNGIWHYFNTWQTTSCV